MPHRRCNSGEFVSAHFWPLALSSSNLSLLDKEFGAHEQIATEAPEDVLFDFSARLSEVVLPGYLTSGVVGAIEYTKS